MFKKNLNRKELANKISKKQKIIGIRQGEKLEEELISNNEKKRAKENKKMWIVRPYTTNTN